MSNRIPPGPVKHPTTRAERPYTHGSNRKLQASQPETVGGPGKWPDGKDRDGIRDSSQDHYPSAHQVREDQRGSKYPGRK